MLVTRLNDVINRGGWVPRMFDNCFGINCAGQKEKWFSEEMTDPTIPKSHRDGPSGSESDQVMKALLGSKDKELKKQFLGNYTPQKRAMDVIDTCLFLVLFVTSFYNLCINIRAWNLWISLLAFALAMLFSDFCSGLMHWAADTWGTFDTPFVGPTFIRSFREHHITPTAMCHHDLFETNGDNCLVTVPVLLWMTFKTVQDSETGLPSNWSFFVLNFWTWVCLFIALTNQFHSWSHDKNAPTIAVILQKAGLILSPSVHRKHHQMPFDRNYCITNGWLEPVLVKIEFWRRAEEIITKYTGLVPREDDKKWTGLSEELPTAILNLQSKAK